MGLGDERYSIGLVLVALAIMLLNIGHPVSALFPAGTAVYVLGSKLWDVLRGK